MLNLFDKSKCSNKNLLSENSTSEKSKNINLLDNIKKFLKNTTSTLPISILIFYLVLYVITMDIHFMILFILNILLGFLFNYFLKVIFKITDPNNKFTKRPNNCGICAKYVTKGSKCVKVNPDNETCTGCDSFLSCNNKSSSPGFPSTNAQIVSMNVIYWSILIFKGNNDKTDLFQVVFLLFILFLSCWEKIASCCESYLQVTFGLIFGISLGIIMYFIMNIINLNKYNKNNNSNNFNKNNNYF